MNAPIKPDPSGGAPARVSLRGVSMPKTKSAPKAKAPATAPGGPTQPAAPAKKAPAAAPRGRKQTVRAAKPPKPRHKSGKTKAARRKLELEAQMRAEAAAVPPPVRRGGLRARHLALMVHFTLFVLLPITFAGSYLWTRAADQYASHVGFSVRKEETSSAIEILGGITELSGSSSSDTDILYEFIQSQKLVREIDAALDLRALWSKPTNDPVFAFEPGGTIEDLMAQWERMVKVYYDGGTGLIEVRVLAFAPEDATAIAQAVFDQSSQMINALSSVAREDAIAFARGELDHAAGRLKEARLAITEFRNRTQSVDPSADIQAQVSLLSTLQARLAESMIDYDLLLQTTRTGDPRLEQAKRAIAVIEERISQERAKLGISGQSDDGVLANLVGEYERLQVEREFAERTYTAALAGFDNALAESRRQTRYLAAHIEPTLAQRAQYPRRLVILSSFAVFLFLIWSVGALIYYSLRDRR